MSRSGYSDDIEDQWSFIRWRGCVASAIRGKRGQALLREMLEALDAMPVKALIAEELELNGEYCALGVLGKKRGIDMSQLDPGEPTEIGIAFNIASPLAQEIVYHNDEGNPYNFTPEKRWQYMRNWVANNIRNGNEVKHG